MAFERAIGVVLLDQPCGERLEGLAVFIGPPVFEVAVAVVLGALVVEAMTDFVADDPTDGAKVDGVFGIHVKERRLQDGRGKDDLVHRRAVIGIDGLRRHEPFVAVHGLADLVPFAPGFECGRPAQVAHQVALFDLQRAIVAPAVGVADLGVELAEFFEGLELGALAHPVQLLDALRVGLGEVGDHALHARLGLGREVLFNIALAQRLAQLRLDCRDGTLPARPVFADAAQGARVKIEMGLDQILGQAWRELAHHPELQIVLHGGPFAVAQRGGEFGDGLGLHDDQGVVAVQAGGRERRAQVEIAGERVDVVKAEAVVGALTVA